MAYMVNRALKKRDDNENFVLKKIELHEKRINTNVEKVANLSEKISEKVLSIHEINENFESKVSKELGLTKHQVEVLKAAIISAKDSTKEISVTFKELKGNIENLVKTIEQHHVNISKLTQVTAHHDKYLRVIFKQNGMVFEPINLKEGK